MVLSADGENDPDVLGVNAASAALHISEIPFMGPIGAVRVGRVNQKVLILQKERLQFPPAVLPPSSRNWAKIPQSTWQFPCMPSMMRPAISSCR